MNYRVIYAMSVLVLLAGCSSREQQKVSTQLVEENLLPADASGKQEQEYLLSRLQRNQDVATFQVRQEEAKLFDVPIPLNVRPLERYKDSDAASSFSTLQTLVYSSTNPLSNLHIFYTTQMEQFGWKIDYIFHGPELVMIFTKPRRHCCITIRPAKRSGRNELVIMITGAE